ncbi:MAG: multicopper oxidase family protein [Pseudomonadota bacterium]
MSLPLSRRGLLHGSAALAGLSVIPGSLSAGQHAPGSNGAKDTLRTLTARAGSAMLNGRQTTGIWGFEGQVPGPVLRVPQGEDLRLRFANQIDHASTIHWHGIRINNAMDGVPGLTQPPVASGQTFDYRFRCPDAGTFWYHPHKMSSQQIGRGLYGALIVDEAKPPQVDRDRVLMFDDWRLDETGQIHAASFGAIHDRAHGGRFGNTFTLNGQHDHTLAVRAGERLRLRLINVANANLFAVRFRDHVPTLIALDGQPITPVPAPEGVVLLGPGQRADVMIDAMGKPGARFAIEMILSRSVETVGHLVYAQEPPIRTTPLDAPIALPANPLTTKLDLANALDVDIPMEGGAMGRLAAAQHHGQRMSLRDLVRSKGYAWALSGHAGMPRKPLFTARRGQTVRLTFRNRSMWPHAMHLHGHHMRDVGTPAAQAWWRDTVLLFRGEEKTVAFVADNPGKWMLHCHMLEHHEGGMGTWFEVTG